MVVVVLGGALWLTKQRADRAADESIDRALDATRSAIDDALTGRSRALMQTAALVAQVPQYVARIGEGLRQSNRANLLDQADEFSDQVGAAWALITDGEGILRAKTNERDLEGEPLAEGALVGIPLEGRGAEGVRARVRARTAPGGRARCTCACSARSRGSPGRPLPRLPRHRG